MYLNDVLHQNLTYQRYKQTFCHYGQLTTNKTSGLIVLHCMLTAVAASLINCLEGSSQIAGTVTTKWMSSSVMSGTADFSRSNSEFTKNLMEWVKTLCASILFRVISSMQIFLCRFCKCNTSLIIIFYVKILLSGLIHMCL